MFKLIRGVILLAVMLNISSSYSISERFLATIFESPTTCAYKNHLHRCTFTFTCWLVGGTSHAGCGDDYDWLFTCCVPSSIPISEGVTAKKPTKQAYSRTPVKKHDLGLAKSSPCGVPAIQLRKRIIGGNEAYFGEFPWQAHIRIAGKALLYSRALKMALILLVFDPNTLQDRGLREVIRAFQLEQSSAIDVRVPGVIRRSSGSDFRYQCGGVLVSQWFVVTAAHCIHRARLRDIKVFLGEYDTQNTGNYIEPLPEEIHKVSKKILHPYFQFKITQPDRFDIALLKLSRKVQYKENILPICLPAQTDSFEGYIGVVAGWGKTDTTYGKTGTNVLQKAGVPILSDNECLEWHQHKNIHVELHQEMFCAGHSDGHMDACLGDSGGPLIVLHNGKWTLAGITSAGFGCAVDHQPGIYHKVALTSKWIAAIINRT